MAITRYENLTVNRVVNTTNSIGQYTTTLTQWFITRGLIASVANSLLIAERYRVYSDLVNITLQYTLNSKELVDNQNNYSIFWRNADWRITNARETDDRMKVILLCYRNDPSTPV